MNNFPEYNCENMGGVSTFNFIQQYGIESFPPLDGNKLNALPVLKTGYDWLKGLALLKSVKFDEDSKDSPAGVLYNYTVSGVYPGQAPNIAELFEEMQNQPLLLDTIDNNNQRRILGNLTNPVEFKFTYSSQPNSRPGYSFSFTWSSPKPAPFYIP